MKVVPEPLYLTMLVPIMSSRLGEEPSSGTSEIEEGFLKIMTFEKSELPGLAHITVIWVSPGDATAPDTLLGDWLSKLTVALAESWPACW